MTTPHEELRSLVRAKKLLARISGANLGEIRDDARAIRKEADAVLRHYPFNCAIEEAWAERTGAYDKMLKGK